MICIFTVSFFFARLRLRFLCKKSFALACITLKAEFPMASRNTVINFSQLSLISSGHIKTAQQHDALHIQVYKCNQFAKIYFKISTLHVREMLSSVSSRTATLVIISTTSAMASLGQVFAIPLKHPKAMDR